MSKPMPLAAMICVLAAVLCQFPCAIAQTNDGALLTLDEAIQLALSQIIET